MKRLSFNAVVIFLIVALFQVSAFSQSPDEKAAFSKVVSSARQMKNMTASFRETKRLKMLSDAVEKTGRLWYQSPSSLRWEYDSRNYGVYNQKGGYMVRDGHRDGASSRGFSAMGKMVTSMMSSLSEDMKEFSVSYDMESGKLKVTATSASARMKAMVDRVIMVFDVSTCHIRSFEMVNNAGSTLITFSSVTTDTEIDRQLFN